MSSFSVVFAEPTLDGLPQVIREQIFSHVIDSEQESERSWAGIEAEPEKTCLPLKTVRPPALARVSQSLREEYLAYFFKHTLFRVDARVNVDSFEIHEALPGRSTDIVDDFCEARKRSNQIPPLMDDCAAAWIRSLRKTAGGLDAVTLRNVLFRRVSRQGEPIGINLTVRYQPSARLYEMHQRVDDGWFQKYALLAYDKQEGGENLHGPMAVMMHCCIRQTALDVEFLTMGALFELETMFRRFPDEQLHRRRAEANGFIYFDHYPENIAIERLNRTDAITTELTPRQEEEMKLCKMYQDFNSLHLESKKTSKEGPHGKPKNTPDQE